MDKEHQKIKQHYERKSDDQLIKLAEEYEQIRLDVLPILFEILEKRDLTDVLKKLKIDLATVKTDNPKEKSLNELEAEHAKTLASRKSKKEQLDSELLDVDFEVPSFDMTSYDYIRKGVKLLVAEKKSLSSKEDSIALLTEKLKLDDDIIVEVFKEITKKMQRSYTIATVIGVVYLVINILLVIGNVDYILIPGLLLIVIAVSNIISGNRLKRLST